MLDSVITNWLKDMRKGAVRFAAIRTLNAVYDRVAVLKEKGDKYYVQYPKRYKKGWGIEKDFIPKRIVISLIYYQD